MKESSICYLYAELTKESEDLKVKEDINGIVHIKGIVKFEVRSEEEFQLLLQRCDSNRNKRCTAFNQLSSRSHTIVEFEFSKRDSLSKFTLVDLAGSEKFSEEQLEVKDHKIESKFINQSLTHLGR